MSSGQITRLTKETFKRFGKYYRAKEVASGHVDDWFREMITEEYVVERPLKFGVTCCDNQSKFSVSSMERHMSSEEVQFACNKSIILSVADSDPWSCPRTKDVVSFLLEPGDVVVLKKGIWHAACHAVAGKTMYYFLSYTNGDPNETKWVNIEPNSIDINLEA